MKLIREIFSESDGQLSLMRLMCFMCLCMAIGYSIFGIITKQSVVADCALWLGYAFAGKVGQKIFEGKSGDRTTEITSPQV